MEISLPARVRLASRELKIFAATTLLLGVSYSMFDSVFNNFLNSTFEMDGFMRSFLEFPRELPGMLVMVYSAIFWFLCSRRLGALALVLGALGAILIGFFSNSYWMMVIWLFIYSSGQHILMPLQSSIGMELAREGRTGQRLGQLNALRNFAAILGSLTVIVGFRYLNLNFQQTFLGVAIGLGLAAALMFSMKTTPIQASSTYLKLHRSYNLYYLLSILFGLRKQLFITFAPWVLVKIFGQPTETLATLFMVGGIAGIAIQPLLGWAIDHLGERAVLVTEAVILVGVCFFYGFAEQLFSQQVALYVIFICFMVDQMSFSVGMARSTYMKKIARVPEDVQPALTAGVSIDHIFSISAALLGGLIWDRFGYQYVFLFGALVAVVNFFAALRVKIPPKAAAA
jgi:predicted MFS family arabinose efflux permease